MVPYKRKEDKATQMRRYRARKKQEQTCQFCGSSKLFSFELENNVKITLSFCFECFKKQPKLWRQMVYEDIVKVLAWKLIQHEELVNVGKA